MDDAEKQGKKLEQAIASHIRKERLRLGWTLDRLAKMTGLSKGYLSQIENHEKTPPIGTLTKIAYGLGLSVVELITGQPQEKPPSKLTIVRDGQQQTVTHPRASQGSVYDSFGFGRADRFMDAYIVSVSHEFPQKPLIHSGQEIALTLSGEHEFFYDGQSYTMKPGDIMYFESNRPHMARSLSSEPARVFVVFCNPASRE
jgi:transcriptional regulator with XRE-family HTH domain